MPITVRFTRDTSEEQKLIENGSCTFLITDRSKDKGVQNSRDNYFFYLSTKEGGGNLLFLGWELLFDAGSNSIKRFGINCSIEKYYLNSTPFAEKQCETD